MSASLTELKVHFDILFTVDPKLTLFYCRNTYIIDQTYEGCENSIIHHNPLQFIGIIIQCK